MPSSPALARTAQNTLDLFLWTAVAMPLVAMVIHITLFPIGLFAWNGNLVLIVNTMIVASAWRYLPALPAGRARAVAGLLAGLLAWTVARTILSDTTSLVVSYSGLIVLASMLTAIAAGYTATRAGMPLPRRLVTTIALAAPALVPLPAMVSVVPDFYDAETWTHTLFGYGQVRNVGSHATLPLAVLVAYLVAAPRLGPAPSRRVRAALWVLVAGLWCTLAWSGSRGGPASLLPAFLLSWVLIARPDMRALAVQVGLAALGTAASMLFWLPNHRFGMFDRAANTLQILGDGVARTGGDIAAVADRASSRRLELWEWSWSLALEKPWTGWGYLPMRALDEVRDVPHAAHAHNSPLDYMVGLGLPAGILLSVAILGLWGAALLVLRRLGREGRLTAWDVALFTGTTLGGIYTLHSAFFISPWPALVFGLSLGVLLARGALPDAPDAQVSGAAPTDRQREHEEIFA